MSDFKNWLVEQIIKCPNITFGSLHRDACHSKEIIYNSHDGSLDKTLKELISDGLITQKVVNYNTNSLFLYQNYSIENTITHYNLGKQLLRDEKLNILFDEFN